MAGNRGEVKQILRIAESELGIQNIFLNIEPHPVRDDWGVGIACCGGGWIGRILFRIVTNTRLLN